MTYAPPLKDIGFALSLAGLPADDTAQAVLGEAARFARDILAPLDRQGDLSPVRLENGSVRASPGFREAYGKFVEAGWNGISAPAGFGGQGLPQLLAAAVNEMWQGACLSFGLCPLLTQGVIHALTIHGTGEQKRLYLPKLISGEWTGTMNLTEPQAGSDVGALKTRAVRQPDGTYRITGTKIFITWGEHDCAANIIHLVLARLPDAPPGTRGVSLFLVPKFLVNADGSPGARNDLVCTGLEHKLGIHGSPTCAMSYGEKGGAVGYLVSAENRGMAAMFTMMNAARLGVGLQGVGVAEAAFQKALAYARERRQGRTPGMAAADSVAIAEHPDVRRMLLTMKALTEAARAICYANAAASDLAESAADGDARARAKLRDELLTPVSKAWSTGIGVTVASLGVQVHGGMGFIEETGAAQYYRDARILPIYEGTNGIQAIDLVTRKLPLDGGMAALAFIGEIETNAAKLSAKDGALGATGALLAQAAGTLRETTLWLQDILKGNDPSRALAGASPYLDMFGCVAGAHFLGLGAAKAAGLRDDRAFAEQRIALAHFFACNILPAVSGLKTAVTEGGDEVLDKLPALG